MNERFVKKNAGIIAFIISTLSIIINFTCIGSMSLGNLLTKLFNININLLSLLGCIISLLISYTYKDSYLSRQAKLLSIICICLLISLSIISVILN